MAKSKDSYYAVKSGRISGIYPNWAECEEQVKGYSGAQYQKFTSRAQAETYLNSIELSSKTAHPVSTLKVTNSKNDSVKPIPLKEPLVVYCDGACKGNGKVGSVAGIGVWWGHNHPMNLAERCPGEQTNNKAELVAICRVLETTPFRKSLLAIKTDSKYSINCFNKWMPIWRDNNWKKADGTEIKNLELIRYVNDLLAARFQIGQSVRLEHVKGHSGIEGNEGADYLANLGATMAEEADRDWSALREAYSAKVDELIEERKLRLAAKDKKGSLEVVGAEEAPEDLKNEIKTKVLEAEAPQAETSSTNKVRRVGEAADASVKDYKLPVVPVHAFRRHSAGVAEPSHEDLEAFAQGIQEEESCLALSDSRKASQSKPALERRYSAQIEKPSEEDLTAYAEAWDEELDVSDIE
ncbi:ribonuclease H-like domain-containing protein [Lentinula detonsa]|uniref:Ribonuclease H n=1 Tax=Lentinula detonsa TaxID=2804962 RepID=A0A9W8U3K4_9AGAR|nr:ribonuclease H-like domain-containing protein [Lentinula detonsa]